MQGSDLPAATRFAALVTAEGLLADLFSDVQVERAIKKEFVLTDIQAKGIVREVIKLWKEESVDDLAESRVRILRALDKLFRRSIRASQLSVAQRCLKLRAEILGVIPEKRPFIPLVEDAQEDDDRTEEDYLFFATNGFYPEESPDTVQ